LRWFWPRAESVVYAEAKRLEADGLVRGRAEAAADGSRRSRTIYEITPAGRTMLADWLTRPPETFAMHLEPLLRVHLARFGRVADLLVAIDHADACAAELLADARAVAAEYVAGKHLIQQEAHVRALLFDALVGQARALRGWAAQAHEEIARWDDVEADDAARARALGRMRAFLAETGTDTGGNTAQARMVE
jgi:DNA-binding PadR family transcriptional regulator